MSEQQRPDNRQREVHLEEARTELGKYGDRFWSLYQADDHGALLEELRADAEFAEVVCRADAITFLRKWFPRTDGWETRKDRSGGSGAAGVAVEWEYRGVHDERSDFNALAPTGRPVIVRGVTMMGVEEKRMVMRRYVDWAGVFAQLGMTLNWRVPVSSTPRVAPGGPDTAR